MSGSMSCQIAANVVMAGLHPAYAAQLATFLSWYMLLRMCQSLTWDCTM